MSRSDKLRDVGQRGQRWSTGVVTFTLCRYYPITDQWSVVFHGWSGDEPGYMSGDAITSFMARVA